MSITLNVITDTSTIVYCVVADYRNFYWNYRFLAFVDPTDPDFYWSDCVTFLTESTITGHYTGTVSISGSGDFRVEAWTCVSSAVDEDVDTFLQADRISYDGQTEISNSYLNNRQLELLQAIQIVLAHSGLTQEEHNTLMNINSRVNRNINSSRSGQ